MEVTIGGLGNLGTSSYLTYNLHTEVVRDSTDPKEYWAAVLNEIPVLPGIDNDNLIRYLSTIPIDQQPCETNLYISVRDRLRAVCAHRESHNFQPSRILDVPDQEEIEALRLYGSAEHGFGTLPNSIEYLLTQVVRVGRWVLSLEVRKVPSLGIMKYTSHRKIL